MGVVSTQLDISAPDVFNNAALQGWEVVAQEANFEAVQPSLTKNFTVSAQLDNVPDASPTFDTAEPKVTTEVQFDNDQFFMNVDGASIMQACEMPPANDSIFGAALGLTEEVLSVSAELEQEMPVVVAENDFVPDVQTQYTQELTMPSGPNFT